MKGLGASPERPRGLVAIPSTWRSLITPDRGGPQTQNPAQSTTGPPRAGVIIRRKVDGMATSPSHPTHMPNQSHPGDLPLRRGAAGGEPRGTRTTRQEQPNQEQPNPCAVQVETTTAARPHRRATHVVRRATHVRPPRDPKPATATQATPPRNPRPLTARPTPATATQATQAGRRATQATQVAPLRDPSRPPRHPSRTPHHLTAHTNGPFAQQSPQRPIRPTITTKRTKAAVGPRHPA
jgi:hypothetical protein